MTAFRGAALGYEAPPGYGFWTDFATDRWIPPVRPAASVDPAGAGPT
jgi:hypothetical protein